MNTAALRILVADEFELTADGIRTRLNRMDGNFQVFHAGSGMSVLEHLSSGPFDLVLLDVSLPGMDGIDTMRAIHAEFPGSKVLAHSARTEIEYVNSMLIEGATGYLLKGGTAQEFMDAVQATLQGECYISEVLRSGLEAGYSYTGKRVDGEYIGLTEREREIIRLIAMERTNGEIATELFISVDTVKTHRKNLMTKLNVRTAAGLVKYAIDRRWV